VGIVLSGAIKDLARLRTNLKGCFVVSVDTGKPVVDPFRAASILPNIWRGCGSKVSVPTSVEEALNAWVVEESNRSRHGFEVALAAYCKRTNLHVEGHFPTFIIGGFLNVHADRSNGFVEVGTSKVKSLFFDSVAPLIKEAVSVESKRKFDRVSFLENLYRAYKRTLSLQGLSLGEAVPINAIFQELVFVLQSRSFRGSGKKAQFAEYTLEFFSRDLAKLIAEAPPPTDDGRILKLGPTSFAADGVPVRHGGSLRIVGRVSFIEGGG
jgi:hypothetical protein